MRAVGLTALVAVMIIVGLMMPGVASGASTGHSAAISPNLTSSPLRAISDSDPDGFNISDDGLILSSNAMTIRDGKIKNFAGDAATDGVLSGTPNPGNWTGIRSNGTRFDGVDDYYTHTLTDVLTSGTVVVDLYRIKTGVYEYPLAVYNGANLKFNFELSTTNIKVGFVGATGMTQTAATASINLGIGHHFVAFTWNTTSYSLYIDNVLKDSKASGCVIPALTLSTVKIGNAAAYYFNGVVYEYHIYSTSKTSSQLFQMYNDTYKMMTPGFGVYSYTPTADQAITAWGLKTNATFLSQDSDGTVHGRLTSTINSWYVNVTATNANGYAWQNFTLASFIPSVMSVPDGSNIILKPGQILYTVIVEGSTLNLAQDTNISVGLEFAELSTAHPYGLYYDGVRDSSIVSGTAGTFSLGADTFTWDNATLKITPVISIEGWQFTDGGLRNFVWQGYDYSADHNCDLPVTWSIMASKDWLSIDDDGTIYGVPDEDGACLYTISATHANGEIATVSGHIVVETSFTMSTQYIVAPLIGLFFTVIIIGMIATALDHIKPR